MMSADPSTRIAQLERTVRVLTVVTVTSSLLLAVLATVAWTAPSQSNILRVRQLILEDEAGRARVLLGAPLPAVVEGGRPLAPRIGMAILDTVGLERFGLSLRVNGSIGMGFDAPVGTGDDQNRERINIVADERGGSYIRFLNRQALVAGFLRLGDDDRMWLEFLDVRPDSVLSRRLSFTGDERRSRLR